MITHGLGFAKDKDLKKVENHYGKWVISDLIGWDRFPTPKFRNKLSKHNYGKARFHLANKYQSKSLHSAAGKYVPGFNPKDGGEEYNHTRENTDYIYNAKFDQTVYCTCRFRRFTDLWRDLKQQTTSSPR